ATRVGRGMWNGVRRLEQTISPAAGPANYGHVSLLQAAPVHAPGRLLAQRQRALAGNTMGGHPAGAGGAAQRLRARGGMVQTKSPPTLSWRIRRLSGGEHGRSGAVDAGQWRVRRKNGASAGHIGNSAPSSARTTPQRGGGGDRSSMPFWTKTDTPCKQSESGQAGHLSGLRCYAVLNPCNRSGNSGGWGTSW